MEDGSRIIDLPEDEYEKIFGPISPKVKKYFARKTNADRIRSMTNKELAKFLCDIVSISDGCYDCVAGKCCEQPYDGCNNGFELWLMQECAE